LPPSRPTSTIFQIERISQGKGLFGPYSLVRAGERIFFFSTQGFHRIDPGGFPTPIGRERIDRSFFADLDKTNLQLFIGAADPRNSRVLWAYKSANGTANQFDKILCYDWVLDRFTPIKIGGEYLLQLSQPGLTLEKPRQHFGLARRPDDLARRFLDLDHAGDRRLRSGAYAEFLPRRQPAGNARHRRTGHRRHQDQGPGLPPRHRRAGAVWLGLVSRHPTGHAGL
jgi:hypothetical protein